MFGDPSSDVGYKIVEGEPFESFLERVEQLKELDEDEQEALLGKLSEESRRVLEAAVDLTDASGFWKEFVDYEELSVEVEESLCETEYHSYFVSDIAAEKASLAKRVQTALAEIRSVGGEYFEDE